MVFVILCGGLGTRMAQGFPKPLTPILASPSLRYALENIAPLVDELIFIYAQHLKAFNFEEVVVNLFQKTRCTFSCVPFATRGAVETALAGLLRLDLNPTTPLVFLDNDSVYSAALAPLAAAPSGPFLGFDFDSSTSAAFSFMRCAPDGAVVEFAEKRRISNQYCTGIYGFATLAQFLHWARHTLQHGPFPNNEIYMSSLFVNMIAAGERISSVHMPIVMLGTARDADAFAAAKGDKLRVCFDLDNTLVTQPRVPGDFSTVAPIPANIALARTAHAAGHTVIIHTARRMAAQGANVGRVIAEIGRVTFDTLERFGIPYDELIFGKPHADVYIDDRALNLRLNSVRALGLPWGDGVTSSAPALPNALPNSCHNSLRVVDGCLVKRGPAATLRGEVFFYESVRDLPIALLFPTFYGSTPPDAASDASGLMQAGGVCEGGVPLEYIPPAHCPTPSMMQYSMSVIKGVPLTTLFRAQLLEQYHLDAVLSLLSTMHTCTGVPVTLDIASLRDSYLTVLRSAFADASVFGARSDAPTAFATIEDMLNRYFGAPESGPSIVPVIHGDASFSNIIVSPTNELRFVDMRGLVSGVLTLNGDPTSDFARMCQSLLGVDEIVFRLPRVPHAYRISLVCSFAASLRACGVNPTHVLSVCVCLTACSLQEHTDPSVRDELWGVVTHVLDPKGDRSWEELVAAFVPGV